MLIQLLILLCVFALVFYLLDRYVAPMFPPPIGRVFMCVLALLCILWLLDWSGIVNLYGHRARWR